MLKLTKWIKRNILEETFSALRVFSGQGIVAAPKDVVWDIDDLSKQPPWKDNILGDITDLSDYFVTSGGEDFITLFFRVLKKVEQFNNQYEAWRFSDGGEILSHRVFRDDREYEEYLKTIYKTEDLKWQF